MGGIKAKSYNGGKTLLSINYLIPSGFPRPADEISEKEAQRKGNGWSWNA
jgi:hypothetical protein